MNTFAELLKISSTVGMSEYNTRILLKRKGFKTFKKKDFKKYVEAVTGYPTCPICGSYQKRRDPGVGYLGSVIANTRHGSKIVCASNGAHTLALDAARLCIQSKKEPEENLLETAKSYLCPHGALKGICPLCSN